jgi:hypothetical protein
MNIQYDFDEFFSSALAIESYAPHSLHFSYNIFLDYFSKPRSPTEVYAAAYMVYGWMPTMLRLKGPTEQILFLYEHSARLQVTPNILSECSKTMNNSVVGSSKFMHFIQPTYYPIWDSRVYRALFSQQPHPYRVEDPSLYFDYLELVHQLCKDPRFLRLHQRVQDEAGYPLSGCRVAELCLYALGSKKTKKDVKS